MSCTLADALVYYVLCSVVCCYDETVSAARSSMRESVFFSLGFHGSYSSCYSPESED